MSDLDVRNTEKTDLVEDKYQLDPKNARFHTPENKAMVDRSLDEVGPFRSVGADRDGIIRVGNLTYETALEKGYEIVEVVTQPNQLVVVRRPDLFGEKAVRAAILDNRAGELAEWDAEVLKFLKENEPETVEGVFDGEEWRALLKQVNGGGGTEDPGPQVDRAEELLKKWQVESGDVWGLPSADGRGEHRVVCGDCEDADTVKKVLGGVRIDLQLADPPYGINVVNVGRNGLRSAVGGSKPVTIGSVRARRTDTFGGVKNIKNSVATVGGNGMVDATLYRPVKGDDKPFDPAHLLALPGEKILFGGNYYASKLPDSRCWIVWDKNNTGNFADAELAWTSFDKGVKLYQFTWNGLVREGERAVEGVKRFHPTQKPVGLFEMILNDYSEEGQNIADFYLGSGTTVLACERTKRRCFGIEQDPAYIAVTLERWATMTGRMPILLERVGGV